MFCARRRHPPAPGTLNQRRPPAEQRERDHVGVAVLAVDGVAEDVLCAGLTIRLCDVCAAGAAALWVVVAAVVAKLLLAPREADHVAVVVAAAGAARGYAGVGDGERWAGVLGRVGVVGGWGVDGGGVGGRVDGRVGEGGAQGGHLGGLVWVWLSGIVGVREWQTCLDMEQ